MEESKIEQIKAESAKKKKKTITMIIIGIIALIAVVVVSVLIISNIGNNKNKDKESTTNEKVETTENKVSKKDEEQILDNINKLKYFDSRRYGFNSLASLSNQDILKFARDYLIDYEEVTFEDEIDEEDILRVVSKYLRVEFNNTNIECSMARLFSDLEENQKYDFLYNENTKKYVPNTSHPAHGVLQGEVYNELISVEYKDNVYEAKVYKAFSNLSETGSVINYYPTYVDATNDTNAIFAGEADKDKIFDDKSKLKVYTYTFVKEDNDFLLNSYKIGD